MNFSNPDRFRPSYALADTRSTKHWLVPLLLLLGMLVLLAGCGASSQQPLPQGMQPAATADSAASDEEDSAATDDASSEADAEAQTEDNDATDTPVDDATDTAEITTTAEDEADAADEESSDADPTAETMDEDAAATAEAIEQAEATAAVEETDDEATPDETEEPATEDEATPTEEPATDEQDGDTASSGMMMDEVISSTRHFKGNADAPVTIIEFSDFQCPYCSRFAAETAPQIQQEYIDEGIVRLGYRHAAYHEGEAFAAAEATECAADQDAFWDYHDLLIDHLVVEGRSDFPNEVLMQYATDLDLDAKMFNTCLETGKYAELVRQETQESATVFGIGGTPSFLVNGQLLVGAQPYEAFSQAIEAAREEETDPSNQSVEVEEPEEPVSQDQLMDMLIEETNHFKGNEDAPVTIIEFSDFQCPYCSRFAADAGVKIHEQYVEEGIVRFGYIHAAYHEGEAYTAAEASECAGEQDAFWDYHDLLIDRMAVEGKNDFPTDVLKQYAADLELDTEAFNTCLDEGRYADLVREQTQLSSYLGVSGTPTFIVNGKGLVGAQPFEVFQQIIEEEQ